MQVLGLPVGGKSTAPLPDAWGNGPMDRFKGDGPIGECHASIRFRELAGLLSE
eukprot:CAMPEP_0171159000 /NCGR_PEP_ID=MMETSP0790-20130122/2807_1 /TAXON_ID=2925 /ORGANISM="Alexandrium catenella, Strain OF101" /LENGTH=52 /DNA_ID=CAMNT_0011623471 /DNA_START=69 /DNA_END=224 /DNA_ORIENTATION=+